MKKSLHPFWEVCSFLPALLLMCTIFSFSAQTGEVSSRAELSGQRQAGDMYFFPFPEKNCPMMTGKRGIDRIHTPAAKCPHERILSAGPLSVSLPLTVRGIRGKKRFLLALAFCTVFAGTDEFHQSFVGGRGPSLFDVFIDSAGAAAGCALLLIFKNRR